MACGQLRLGGGDQPEPEDVVGAAAKFFGIRISSDLVIDEEFYLWPENEPVFMVWLAVATQWNVSDGVKRSLNYPGVQVVLKYAVKKQDRAMVFARLQLMEQACLTEWARNRK